MTIYMLAMRTATAPTSTISYGTKGRAGVHIRCLHRRVCDSRQRYPPQSVLVWHSGPTGDLYVTSEPNAMLSFQGPDGVSPGAFVYEATTAGGISGLDGPAGLVVGSDGNVYVSSRRGDEVLRYSQGVTATLSSVSDVTITVDFATFDGTATGSDYASLNRTLTFAPGETSKKILLAATDDDRRRRR